MNTSADLQLTTEEVIIIEDARLAQAKAEAVEHNKNAEAFAKVVEKARREGIKITDLANELRAADVNNIFDIQLFNTKNEHKLGEYDAVIAKISFMLGTVEYYVTIEEHNVYSSTAVNSSARLKFLISGSVNDYKNKWLTRATSVVRAVERLMEAHRVDSVAAKKKMNRITLTDAAMAEKYPSHDVVFERGYYSERLKCYTSDKWMITADNQVVTFTSHILDDKLTIKISSIKMDTAFTETVAAMIIGTK